MSRWPIATWARRYWREYTRMRTAIFFLVGVAAVAVVGSFVPQAHTSAAQKVDEFLGTNPHLNQLFASVGFPLTEVFVSPLFYVLIGSLFLSLLACVVRRGRALVTRTLRGHPRTPQFWGEWGSWLFHTSFFLLVVAAILGKATGFQGLVAITEGQRFTEARAGYDDLQEGVLFSGRHSNAQFQLNHFSVSYASNGQANDFVSSVTVYDHGRSVTTKDVRVNDFLGYGDVAMYQQDYGWAPHILVRNPSGTVIYDSTVQLFGDNRSVQTGVFKAPDLGYKLPGFTGPTQMGGRLALFPDAHTMPHVNPDGTVDPNQTSYAPGGFEARNPVLMAQLFIGDLGLDGGTPQNVNALNTGRMMPVPSSAKPVPLALGDELSIPVPGANGTVSHFTISFSELRQYSLFQIKRDNGVGLVYVSFALLLAGLLTKLYVKPLLEKRQRQGRPVQTLTMQQRGLVLDGMPSDRVGDAEREPVAEPERQPVG
jgi:cytochrome c biogenesis protein